MTRPVIVSDASVALAWILGESAAAWVTGLWDAVTDGRVDVKVPTFFWLEIGNRLIRQRDVAGEQVLEGIIRLEALSLRTIEMDRSLRLLAIHLAQRFHLSTYDALYVALAETSDLPLATLDHRLGAAAAALGRRYGDDPGPAIGEASVSYGSDRAADPMSLAALGAYLAELRAEIAATGRGTGDLQRPVPHPSPLPEADLHDRRTGRPVSIGS